MGVYIREIQREAKIEESRKKIIATSTGISQAIKRLLGAGLSSTEALEYYEKNVTIITSQNLGEDRKKRAIDI